MGIISRDEKRGIMILIVYLICLYLIVSSGNAEITTVQTIPTPAALTTIPSATGTVTPISQQTPMPQPTNTPIPTPCPTENAQHPKGDNKPLFGDYEIPTPMTKPPHYSLSVSLNTQPYIGQDENLTANITIQNQGDRICSIDTDMRISRIIAPKIYVEVANIKKHLEDKPLDTGSSRTETIVYHVPRTYNGIDTKGTYRIEITIKHDGKVLCSASTSISIVRKLGNGNYAL